MKIVINNVEYTAIKSLDFTEQVDILSSEIPVNEFVAELNTTDDIPVGVYAYLYDKDNNLWAKYWVVDAVRYVDEILTITCQSEILLLDRKTVPAIMYSGVTALSELTRLFAIFNLSVNVDASLQAISINGYCPEQTVRERIQQICFVIGGYVKTAFLSGNATEIKAIDDETITNIFSNEVFQYPQISNSDYVTGIRVLQYSFRQGQPETVDEYVQIDNGDDTFTYYIYTTQEAVITNPNAPSLAPENIIEFTDVMLINSSNFSDLLTRLSTYYFKRGEVEADVLNDNGDYSAGHKYMLDCGNGDCAVGFMSENSFTFGYRNKSSITINQADVVKGVKLTVNCMYEDVLKGIFKYHLPSGYGYKIQNPNISLIETDSEDNFLRRVYSPIIWYAEGTMPSEDTTITMQYRLSLEQQAGILRIFNVDNLDFDEIERVIEIE